MHWYLVSSFLFPLLKIAFFSKELMMLQQKVFCVNKLCTAQKKIFADSNGFFFALRFFLREIAPIDLYRLEKHWSILLLYFSEAGCENHKNCNEHYAFQSVLPILPNVSQNVWKIPSKIAKTGNTGFDQNNSRSLIFFIDPQRHCLWQIMT